MIRPLYSIQKLALGLLLTMALGSVMTSCDGILDNGYGDCEVIEEYRVKFKYDYNMKYADAFPHEVRSVRLYAFADDGTLAGQWEEKGELLAEKDYTMRVELPQGNYRFVTWAGLENQESFTVPAVQTGTSTVGELTCRMNRIARSAEETDSVGYLNPLWHGEVQATLAASSRATLNTHYVEVPLVKNTNTIRIILQQLSDGMVDVKEYEFQITDSNGHMNHDNTLLEDAPLTYYPYYYAQGSTEVTTGSRSEEQLNMAVAELSVGRLMADRDPKLVITLRSTGETVLSIPLVSYLKLCKMVAHYDMSDQEYLDREDEYNMTFFLDQNNRWVNTQIIINDWIVRFNDFKWEW